jgi:molybdate transport system substrate-binding protein
MRSFMKPFRPIAAALVVVLFSVLPAAAAELTVFAAASMTDALKQIGADYEKASGDTVRFSFASSSTLARQIEAGAPVDVFVSADTQWMDYLAQRHLIDESSRVDSVGNSLVLVSGANSGIKAVDPAKEKIISLLGKDGKIALGDPAHVPAGIYAKEALTSLGQWQAVEPRVAAADDVRAALALVERGEVPLGIVYKTDAAIAKNVRIVGTFPASSHKPVVYPMAIMKDHDSDASKHFLSYLTGAEGTAVLQKFGFVPLK